MRKMTEKEFRVYSLTSNLYHLIVEVGTPLAIFALFNTLFSILDTIMASHLGTIDVSTVAYMAQLRMILNAIGSGLVTGSMILINRSYGAGESQKAHELMNSLFRLMAIITLVFLALIPFVPLILRAIGTPEEFIAEGTPYFRLLIAATAINFLNLIYINVEKSRGNTKTIMMLNIITMVIKLILSAFFIYVLEKGIVYIALATLITYSLFALYSLIHLFDKRSIFSLDLPLAFKTRRGDEKRLISISYPVAVEDSAFSLGKVVVNALASSYGAEMIGALGISNNICGIPSNFENGFSAACLIAMCAIYILDEPLIRVFATSKDGLNPDFMSMIGRIFIYDSISCIGIAINGAGMDFLLGLGKTKITLLLNFLKIFVLRIPVLFILQLFIEDGATALGVMMMISNCGIAIPTTLISLSVARKLIAKEENNSIVQK